MRSEKTKQEENDVFSQKLLGYKKLIDDDLAQYSRSLQKQTLLNYGVNSRIAVDAFVDMLSRGGKRLRGAMTMLAYEMSGGKDNQMIIKAARAIEIIHVYILIMDDINDRSTTRRGGPTVHYILKDYHHKNHLADDSLHFGESIAMNVALLGAHSAQSIMANLEVDESLRLKGIDSLNKSMVVTAHGQFNDVFNEVIAEVKAGQVDKVYEWKTAHYTFLNPLKMGMILAGAGEDELEAVAEFAMHAGRLFQISDDMLGTFSNELESGKSPLDDIKEGKQTLLVIKAVENSSKADGYFLRECLGKQNLSKTDFERCKQIIIESGSLDYSKQEAAKAEHMAEKALENMMPYWPIEGIEFLDELTKRLADRKN